SDNFKRSETTSEGFTRPHHLGALRPVRGPAAPARCHRSARAHEYRRRAETARRTRQGPTWFLALEGSQGRAVPPRFACQIVWITREVNPPTHRAKGERAG